MHVQKLQVDPKDLPEAFKRKFFPSVLSTNSHPPALPPATSLEVADHGQVPDIAVVTSSSTKRGVSDSSRKKHVVKVFVLTACLLKLGILDHRKCFPTPKDQKSQVDDLSCQQVLLLFQQALSSKSDDTFCICPLGLLHSLQGQGPAKAAIPNCTQEFTSKIVFAFLV